MSGVPLADTDLCGREMQNNKLDSFCVCLCVFFAHINKYACVMSLARRALGGVGPLQKREMPTHMQPAKTKRVD
jgi:hypothetical protein